MEPFDRSLLAHEAREKYLSRPGEWDSYHLVWVQGKDGKVFGSCLSINHLGRNGIVGGVHDGLLWWPQDLFG